MPMRIFMGCSFAAASAPAIAGLPCHRSAAPDSLITARRPADSICVKADLDDYLGEIAEAGFAGESCTHARHLQRLVKNVEPHAQGRGDEMEPSQGLSGVQPVPSVVMARAEHG